MRLFVRMAGPISFVVYEGDLSEYPPRSVWLSCGPLRSAVTHYGNDIGL